MKRHYWLAASIIFGIVLLIVVSGQQSEPHYAGKPLTHWLRGFESEEPQTRWKSAEAIRHIGTNAMPFIVQQLESNPSVRESAWKQKLRATLSYLKITLPRPANERGEALAALDALGPTARNAAPALEKLLHENPPDPQAILVLARLGPDGIPALTRALTNDEKVIRHAARVGLDMQRSHSKTLFPATPQDAEFMRRTCEFNLAILKTAFQDYRREHPDDFLPDGMPKPSLPDDFTPETTWNTNSTPPAIPSVLPGYE